MQNFKIELIQAILWAIGLSLASIFIALSLSAGIVYLIGELTV